MSERPEYGRKREARREARREERLQERAEARRVLRVISGYVRPEWRGLLATIGLLVAGTVAALLAPWPYKILIDEVFATDANGDFTTNLDGSVTRWLMIIAAAIAGIALLKATIHFLKVYVLEALSQRIGFRVRVALYDSIQDHSLSFHQRQRTGDLLTRVTKDVDKVQELTTGHLVDGIDNLLTLVGMVGVLLYLDWQLAVGMLCLIPLLWFTTGQFRRIIKAREHDVRDREGEITSIAQEAISSIRLVKSLGRERYEAGRFRRQSSEQVDATLRVVRTEALFAGVLSVILGVATAALVWLAANRVLVGAISVGQLIVFVEYIKGLQGPTRSLSKFTSKLTKTALRASKIVEILDEEPAVKDLPGAEDPGQLEGHVTFDGVTFGYEPDQPVLDEVDLAVRPGEVLAIVGSTGAGKSTIASLIPRLYDPDAGRVLVDGHDIRDFTLEGLRRNIGVVLQESVLMHATIAQNIEYGRPGATMDEIVAAARAAHAHEFIEKLPAGYATMVGERGGTLSGGQRQRIAIARALVRDAPILILDEPTTGLDADAERVVLDALDNLMRDRTTVVIAHNLSTVRKADTIVVVEDGRVREVGTHDGLLARGDRYAELHALQTTRMQPDAVTRHDDRPSEAVSSGNGSATDLPIPLLRDEFDLGPWELVERLRGGKNRHWRLVAGERVWFIRGSRRTKTPTGVRFEHALLEHLRADHLSTPRPVPTRDGSLMVLSDRIYTITEACPGQPYEPGNRAQIASAGETLAHYHRHVAGFESPVDPPLQPSVSAALRERLAESQRLVDTAGRGALRAAGGAEMEAAFDEVCAAAEQTLQRLEAVNGELPRCVAHCGFRRGSVLFEDDAVRSLLDFDSSRPDIRALDLAVALHDWSKIYTEHNPGMNKVELDLDIIAAFARAYRGAGGEITEDELEVIPCLMRGRRVRRALGRFLDVLEDDADEDDIDKIWLELRRIRWLMAHEDGLRGAIHGSAEMVGGEGRRG